MPTNAHSISGEIYRKITSVAGCTRNAGATKNSSGDPAHNSRPPKYPNRRNSPRA